MKDNKTSAPVAAETAAAKDNPVEKVKVKLIAEHTHQGKLCAPGDEIDVRPDQRERLVKAERAVAV